MDAGVPEPTGRAQQSREQGEPGQPHSAHPSYCSTPCGHPACAARTLGNEFPIGKVGSGGQGDGEYSASPHEPSLLAEQAVSDTRLTQLLRKRGPGCSRTRVRWLSPALQHQGPHSCHSAVPQSAAWQGGLTEAALPSSKYSPKSRVRGALTRAHGSHSCPGAEPGRPRLLSPCAPATVTRQGGLQVLHSQPFSGGSSPPSCIVHGREPGRPRGRAAVFTAGDND